MFNQLSNQVENKKSWLIVLTTQHLNDSNSVFQKLQTSKQHNTFARNEKKNTSSGGRFGPKMEMESGRDGWEMRLAVQKNILPRSQILTNGETPLERDGWSRGRKLVLNEKKCFVI